MAALRQSRIKIAIVLVATCTVAIGATAACKCILQPVEEHVAQSDLILIGTVSETETVESPGEAHWRIRVKNYLDFFLGVDIPRRYGYSILRSGVRVDRVLKGQVDSRLQIDTNSSEAACGFAFEPGETYLVFADVQDDGTVWTGLCYDTTRLEYAGDKLARVEELLSYQEKAESVESAN